MKYQTNKQIWQIIFITIPLLTLALFLYFAKGNFTEEWIILTIGSLVAQAELFWGIHHLAFSKQKNASHITIDKVFVALGILYFLLLGGYFLVKQYAAPDYASLMLNVFPIFTAFSLLFPLGTLLLSKKKNRITKEDAQEGTTNHSNQISKSRFWELSFAKEWIAGSLAVALLLSGIYLFVIDTNRPRAYKADIDKETVEQLITKLKFENNVDTLQEIHQNRVDALVHFYSKEKDKHAASLGIGHWAEDKNATYYSYEDLDTEVVFTPCHYNPLVVKWGYGWYHKKGNFYASLYDEESAKSLPNYRNFFLVSIRTAEKNWSFSVFSKQQNVEKLLEQVILTYNRLEDVQ